MPQAPLSLPLLLAASLALAAGCDELVPGTAGQPAPGASGQPTLTQGRPATPGPAAVATPERGSPPPVATPLPHPVPTVTPTPPPIAPSQDPAGSPSPGASASPAPSPSPTASPSPGAPGDLAISGPGYFVLATKPYPLGLEDLLFTRQGRFRLEAEQIGAVSVQRLRHADHAFYVVGYQIAGTPPEAPAETALEDAVALATSWAGEPVAAFGLYLDADRNPQAQARLGFDFTGRLQLAGAAPRAADGGPATSYVAIAQFDSPDRLVPAVGFAGILRYEVSALEADEEAPPGGQIHLGVAVSGAGRTVGNANLIRTGTLESP